MWPEANMGCRSCQGLAGSGMEPELGRGWGSGLTMFTGQKWVLLPTVVWECSSDGELDWHVFPAYSVDSPQEELANQAEPGSHLKWRNQGNLIMSTSGWQRPVNLFFFFFFAASIQSQKHVKHLQTKKHRGSESYKTTGNFPHGV